MAHLDPEKVNPVHHLMHQTNVSPDNMTFIYILILFSGITFSKLEQHADVKC